MVWVGRDLIDHLIPTPMLLAGTTERGSLRKFCFILKIWCFFSHIWFWKSVIWQLMYPEVLLILIFFSALHIWTVLGTYFWWIYLDAVHTVPLWFSSGGMYSFEIQVLKWMYSFLS